jgi:Skp family chaperone for outer membrane proteins
MKMRKVLFALLLLLPIPALAQQPKAIDADKVKASPPLVFKLSPEQSKALADIDTQFADLDRQIKEAQARLNARASGFVDAFKLELKLDAKKQWQLVKVDDRLYGFSEVVPPANSTMNVVPATLPTPPKQ